MTIEEISVILKEHYPFKKISELQLLKGGVSNDNYVFSDGSQKYVARICLFESKNQINSLVPFLKYAEEIAYPAPRLIPTSNGSDYVLSNKIPIIVTTHLEGASANTFSIDAQHLKSLAQLVANFHNIKWTPPNEPITLNPDYIFGVYDEVSSYNPTDKDEDSLRLIKLVDHYYDKFKEEKFTEFVKKLPQGITHGDIIPGNVMFEGSEAVSLLDFEELGVSWQLQDVAMILNTWTFDEGTPKTEYIESFLKEYKLHRPLADSESRSIVKAMEFIAFRQCVYAKRMMYQGRMKSVKNFSSYWTLLFLYENGHSFDKNQRYDDQWDIVDTFYNTNEPEGFGSTISPDEAEALKTYYFVNPKEHNVYDYSEQLAIDNPELVKKAKIAARKIAVAEGLSVEEIKGIFSSDW